jgi:CelD/BcsL family acetyltransferase involved in cellulose biosynthesis
MAHLGKSTKKQLHRCLNAYRGLVTEWSESVDSAESIFEDLVRLHQARWTAVGQPGAYSSQRFRGFHLDLIRKLVPHQQAALFRVSHEGTVIGCLHLLIDRNRVLSYQCGWSSPTGSLSPGLLTEYLCLEESLRRGFLAYDMLAGPTRHKSSLSTDCSRLLWYRKRRPRLKYRVLDIARSIKRRWRRASETPSV